MSRNLFEESDDELNEDSFQIKTNESYAKTYNSLRKKELLQKFKEKGLEASESDSDDSDSSEEDETLDPLFDQDFLKTLASLKSKDPSIYDKNTKFFKNEENSGEDFTKNSRSKDKKAKPVTLKDYERKIILEKDGKFVDDSEEDNSDEEPSVQRPLSPSMAEEERRLKAEFKKVMNDGNGSSDEEFGGIFKKRVKSKAEKDKDEEDYLKWLAGKKETINENVKEKLEPLKNYWSNDKLPSGEKFLRDYILNKGYTEATNYNEIPTYEEIVGDPTALSEDEDELEKQAEFEQKYNFRYEEPDQEFIKRYPRTIETSLRSTDEKRKKKRQEMKERKIQEKEQKLKELEMVKEMKRKEIKEKIEKLKMVTGNDELGFKDDDLDEDFDPEAHDRRMQELFNDDYYQVDEGEEKPECPPDLEELKVEDWDNYDPRNDDESQYYDYNEPHCEDDNFNMDCDYDPAKAKEELQKELIENTKKRRGGRKGRRDRFMEVIKAEKPIFDPEDEKTYGEYIDEYYKLDCEDIIGDTPCRFKYVETTPNDFGLSIEEILLAKNKELNQWASLKKAIQIRPDHVEKKEQRLFKLKSKNEELKRKIFKSLYGEGSDNEDDELEMETKMQDETLNKVNSAKVESKKSRKKKRKAQQASSEFKLSIEKGSGFNAEDKCTSAQNAEDTSTKKVKTDETGHIEASSNNNVAEEKNLGTKKKKNKAKCLIEKIVSNEKNQHASTSVSMDTKSGTIKEISTAFKDGQKSYPSSDDSKIFTKNNPFTKDSSLKNSKGSIGDLPPLRKNLRKEKKLDSKSNAKFKSKFQAKKQFKGKRETSFIGDSKNISDERLKAYGINPKKFHKKQKYGNTN